MNTAFDVVVEIEGEKHVFDEVEARTEAGARREMEQLLAESGTDGRVLEVHVHKYPSRPMSMADLDNIYL